jgi:pimeloyl-ACP methyl ester carboxylesterase
VKIPVLVIWGEADRIVTPVYGAAFAAAFPKARFEGIAKAGHLP